MKPRIGIFGLSGCWGEQIVILNCEDHLMGLFGLVDVVDFLGGSSQNDEEGPLDIALVEGSVGNARDENRLRRVRERSKTLVACGSCACFGGVQAQIAGEELAEAAVRVYGDHARDFDIAEHRPLSTVVPVEAAIPGCPMEREEFLRAVACLLNGDPPLQESVPVCRDCQMNEYDCLLTRYGIPCTGSVTLGGCDARCPGHGVPCIGCRGPVEEANVHAWQAILQNKGWEAEALQRRLRTFASPVLSGRDA